MSRELKIRIVLKDDASVKCGLAGYLVFKHSRSSTEHGASVRIFQSWGKNYVIIREGIIVSIELSDYPRLHAIECLYDTGSASDVIVYGAFLPLWYVKKIIDENTGRQIWPPRGPTF